MRSSTFGALLAAACGVSAASVCLFLYVHCLECPCLSLAIIMLIREIDTPEWSWFSHSRYISTLTEKSMNSTHTQMLPAH